MRSPEARTKLRTPQTAQRALKGLSGSRFFAGVAERALCSPAVTRQDIDRARLAARQPQLDLPAPPPAAQERCWALAARLGAL